MRVKKGERFSLVLEGKGWYLRGYDSDVLGFVSRETAGGTKEGERAADQGSTVFVFHPFRKGTGHLFFTRQGTESLVRVHIESEEGENGDERARETGAVGEPGAENEFEALIETAAAGVARQAGSPVAADTAPAEDGAIAADITPAAGVSGAARGEKEAGPPEAAGASLEATPPLPPASPALEPASEPAPPSAPKAEPRVKEPSVPLAEPMPVPEPAPKVLSGTPSPAKASGSGEPSKSKGEKAKQGEGSRERSDAGAKEQSGMYYTDKQDRVVGVPYKSEEDAYRRGSQLYQKGQGDKAIDEYLVYLAECKTCAHREQVHYRVAELYVEQGRDGDALAHLDALLKASSTDLRLKAYLLRADIDLRSGDMKRAIEGYSAAWNIDARSKELPRKIADLYYAAKEFDKALPLYERSIENGSADDEVYFRAAAICDGEGRTRNLEKAYGYYKTLVERFKSSSHADYARKRVAFLEKNFYNFK
jgi:hypothetical protein